LGRKIGTLSFYDLDQHPDVETYPNLSILRFDGGLFFVNADALGDRIRTVRTQADAPLNGVILSMEGVNFIDAEGADMVKKVAQAGQEHGIDLHLARVKPQVMEILERDEVVDVISREHIHDSISSALAMHLKKYPSEQVAFQDLKDLLDKAKSEESAEHD
jgi:MFS superfamily sulfate permease-like transporter